MTTIDSSAGAYTSIDDLSVELADGVLSVTMNRPDSLNSLTAAMLAGIGDALEKAARDPRVRGGRAWGGGRGLFLGGGVRGEGHTPSRAGGSPGAVPGAGPPAGW